MKNLLDWADNGSEGLVQKYADGDEGIKDILDILLSYDGTMINSLMMKLTKDDDAINAFRVLTDHSVLKEFGLDEVFNTLKAIDSQPDLGTIMRVGKLRKSSN
jgi:hypothetical protein